MYLDFDAPAEDHAERAVDLLIATLYALNATDDGMGQRQTPVTRLAYQEPGSAFQHTSDALRATLRALLSDVDPDGALIDRAMTCALDLMGETHPARTIREWARMESL